MRVYIGSGTRRTTIKKKGGDQRSIIQKFLNPERGNDRRRKPRPDD